MKKTCGKLSLWRGSRDLYYVDLGCLDNADPSELADAPVNYADGWRDNWQSPPAETRHL